MTIARTLFISGIALAALGFGGSVPARAAGFFDDLAGAIFGRPAPRAVEFYDPLDVTVRSPRRVRAPEVSSKPAPPVVKLDPATQPDWYLRDPTLRRGDIVVTNNGVLVYQGRDSDALRRSDFATLGSGRANTKRSGSAGWQAQLQQAAAGGRSFFRFDTPRAAIMAASDGAAKTQ